MVYLKRGKQFLSNCHNIFPTLQQEAGGAHVWQNVREFDSPGFLSHKTKGTIKTKKEGKKK